MKQLILLLLSGMVFTSCFEETIEKEAPERNSHIIEFVTLGFAENPTDKNKGFGAFYYCYLNLTTDSVFIQQKINPIEQPETFAWAGTIPGLSNNSELQNYLGATKQYKSGEKISEPIEEGANFCGPTYAIRNYKAGVDNIHYFTTNDLDVRYVQVKDFILSLRNKDQLKPVNTIDEDVIVVPIVSVAGSDLRPPPPPDLPPPPPPVRAKIR